MKIVRNILGQLLLFLDWVFSPKPIKRDSQKQADVDQITKNMVLYQFKACPFCIKVRRTIKRLNLKIECREAQKGTEYGNELLENGGSSKVPCLKIINESGTVQWMYESSSIVEFLKTRAAL
ncbi:MAG: glutathione S-transferase N-terminal domain-containing protein [Bdellovibrionota bacterium]